MAKVFIYPATSLLLSDMVERWGHEALGAATSIREKIQTPSLDSPPLQMTPEDPKKGLKYAAVEVPCGVRGRMSLYGFRWPCRGRTPASIGKAPRRRKIA